MKNVYENKFITVELNEFRDYGDGISNCGGGRCPRVLINDNGDAIIQGYSLSPDNIATLDVPNGENVIFLSKDVLAQLRIKFE